MKSVNRYDLHLKKIDGKGFPELEMCEKGRV